MTPEKESFNLETRYREVFRNFKKELEGLKNPLGHGTTSEHVNDILQKGLGAEFPEDSTAEVISLTDLNKPDGLLGAYAFARTNLEELTIKSEDINGKDIISRYAEKNLKITEQALREKFNEYRQSKKRLGFPALFIFEGRDLEFNYSNPSVPSEVELTEAPISKPEIILVPQSRVLEVESLIDKLKINCKVLPIEALEVD